MAPRNRSVGGEVPRKQITCKRLSKGRTGSNAAVSQEPPLVFDRPRGHGAAFPERSCPDFGDGQAGAPAGRAAQVRIVAQSSVPRPRPSGSSEELLSDRFFLYIAYRRIAFSRQRWRGHDNGQCKGPQGRAYHCDH